MKIADNLRIRLLDEHNWVIETPIIHKKPGRKERWRILGYYGTLEDALEASLEHALRLCVDQDICDSLSDLRTLICDLAQSLSERAVEGCSQP